MYANWRQYVGDPLMLKEWPKRLRLGINGYGQIARTLLRCALEDNRGLDVVAINECTLTPEEMIYLTKYDSIHGPFKGFIKDEVHVVPAVKDEHGEYCSLEIAGRFIAVFRQKDPEKIPWHWLNVEYVLETTGNYRLLTEATKHLVGGRARKVLVVGDAIDIPLLMYPISCRTYQRGSSVVASGSPMSHAIATIVSVVDQSCSMVECMVTLILPVEQRQNTVDGVTNDPKSWRKGRGAMQSIIPGRCPTVVQSVVQALPKLKGRIDAITMHVPVVEGAVVDLSFRTNEQLAGTNDVMERLTESKLLETYNTLHSSTQPIGQRIGCDFQKPSVTIPTSAKSSTADVTRHYSEQSQSVASSIGVTGRNDLKPMINLPKDLTSIVLPLNKDDAYVSTDCTAKHTMSLLSVDCCLGLPSGNIVKLISWFDTGISYCERILDTVAYMRIVDNS